MSNLIISDNDVIPSFHTPILFPSLRNISPAGSFLNCCCWEFCSYFETHPGYVTSRPLDSGSSVIPTKTTVNLPGLQGLLLFFIWVRLISFLPGVNVVDLIYPCWETVMVLIKLRVSHWFGGAYCGEELPRDLLRDLWASTDEMESEQWHEDRKAKPFWMCEQPLGSENGFACEF